MRRILSFVFGLMFISTILFVESVSAQQITDEAKKRAAELVAKMTLEEKLDYIGGHQSFYIRAIPRLGIPEIRMADGPQGVRNNTNSTMYASGIAVAATWNREAVYNMGVGLGQDCRARGVHILLGPGVNIYRSPLCGRNFEYFGEDPYLAAQTTVQYVKGVQSQGAMACVKHFAANNQEWERHHVSSDVDERTLHEIYLPAFRAAVEEANIGSVMCSYNMINNVHGAEHRYLNIEVLRDMWGFEGIFMSDWNSTYSAINSANGGLDLEMPSGKLMNKKHLMQPIADGIVDVRTIDTKVQNILQTLIAFGFFDRPQKDESISERNPFSDKAALELARNGVVLLKNDGILPLKSRKVAVTGRNAWTIPTGGGSGFVHPFETKSVTEGMMQMKNYKVVSVDKMDENAIKKVFFTSHDLKTPGLSAHYFPNKELAGEPVINRTEYVIEHLWNSLKTPYSNLIRTPQFSVRWSGVFCSPEEKELELFLRGDDGYRLFIDNKEVISDWRNHSVTYQTYVFKAEANRKYDIRIEYYNHDKKGEIGLDIYDLQSNKRQLREADAVIACVGFDSSTEAENKDRSFELPYKQGELLKRIAEINPNLIVVVNSGGGFEMASWMDKAKAILLAWYPGQEGGQAIAEILTGKLSPSGRLPISIERDLKDNPTDGSYYHNLDVVVRNNPYKRVNYKEGVFLGYRGYDRKATKPLFPFGFGLSYTSFRYDKLQVSEGADGYLVEFDVTNTGKMDAAEVAQVYVGYNDTKIPHPIKELKGYDKVMIPSGATHHFAITIPYRSLEYYDIVSRKMVQDRDVKFYVGASSADIRLTK